MPKAKIYATNVSGKSIRIKAFSMKQIAELWDIPLRELRPWISICGPAVTRADVDLTIIPKQAIGHIVEDTSICG